MMAGRQAIWLGVVVSGLFGCGAAKYALLPSANLQSARNPDLTAPLVETPPPREAKVPRPTTSGPTVDLRLSGAAVAAWILGGVAPLIGVYGTFDENEIVAPRATPKPPAR